MPVRLLVLTLQSALQIVTRRWDKFARTAALLRAAAEFTLLSLPRFWMS
jgi:hypothetical protein